MTAQGSDMPGDGAAAETTFQNVDVLQLQGKQIVLVGTAHVSHQSVELVAEAIDKFHPDSIAVELCPSRYESLKDPERWKKTDIVALLRSGKGFLLLAQLLLAGYQKRLGEKLKVKPGAEMMKAVEIADGKGVQVVLADRDIRTTLRRIWRQLSFWDLSKLVAATLEGLFSPPDIAEEEIERLKESDALEEALKEFSDHLPSVRATLIDERDKYLCAKISGAPGPVVLGVVGAAHVPGIKRYLGQDIDLAALETVPPRSLWGKLTSWGIPVLFAVAVSVLVFRSGASAGVEVVGSWALVTACFGALGALVARAHPLTILTAFLTAPITPINPIVKSGRAAALVEAIMRRPQVEDFEGIGDAVGSFRGFYHNRVSRIFLILLTTALSTWVGIVWGATYVVGALK